MVTGKARRGPRRPTQAAPPAEASLPEPLPVWTGKLQIQATPEMVEFLDRQGARSDRGRSTFSLASVIRRQFELFLAMIEESDPRATRGFRGEFYDLTVEVLATPWAIGADTIRLLDRYIARQPSLPRLLEEAAIDRATYLQAILDLSFAERLHLVEKALVRHAPPSQPATP